MLLYLIRRQNLDILDIPIAEITRQYMRYIELMQVLQLELAGEYLLMAATLAEVKSRMLLPRIARPRTPARRPIRAPSWCGGCRSTSASSGRPRASTACRGSSATPGWRRAELVDRKVVRIPPQVTLQEMLLAFQEVLSRSDMFAHHHVQREPLSVRQRMTEVVGGADARTAFVDFVRLFRADEGRRGVTVTFVAILELLREGLIEIVQPEAYGPLHVRLGNPARHLTVVAADDAANDDISENLMNDQYVRNVIEAALLAAGRPLAEDEIGGAVRRAGRIGAEESSGGAPVAARRIRDARIGAGGGRERLSNPDPGGGGAAGVAPLAGAAGQIFPRVARNLGAGRVPAADHARRNRTDSRRRR